MSQASILRNNIALSMAFAEPSEFAAGYQPWETAPAGRATASQPEDGIVAERALIQVRASEAGRLLDDLRLQLATQPDARLSIRWRLTRPAEAK
jgi:hypothetical protein